MPYSLPSVADGTLAGLTTTRAMCFISPFILSMVISSVFTIDEMKKRFKHHVPFKSPLLKWFSFLSIISGFPIALFVALFFFNGFCYFAGRLAAFIYYLQPMFVGSYALNRLYYLFVEHKAPNGYPVSLFIGMALVAVLLALSTIALDACSAIPKECGWRGDHKFHYEYWYFIDHNLHGLWYGINITVYLLWELIILLLFVFKMRSLSSGLTSSAELMVNGIRKEMKRIIILTILYIIACCVEALWFVAEYEFVMSISSLNGSLFIYGFTGSLRPIVMSYAVYLMQRHNAKEYGIFLQRVTFCKLHFCCCCYRTAVFEQLEYFKPDGGASELKERLLKRQDLETELMTAYGQFSLDVPPESRSVP